MAGGARGIQSIEVSGRILNALVEACAPMMLRDLAHAANLAPAQCHAYLTSLRDVGLVHQDPGTGLYCMGPFAMRLGIGWLRSWPLSSAAIDALKLLTDELGFMSLVTVCGEYGPTVVHINTGVAPSALNIRQGTLFSLTGTATGRIFAAFDQAGNHEEQISAELFGAPTSRSLGAPMTREEFEEQARLAREYGYATAKGAPIPDINAVSVPVFDQTGHFAFAATLIGPSDELEVGDNAPAVRRLLETATSITHSVTPRHATTEQDVTQPA